MAHFGQWAYKAHCETVVFVTIVDGDQCRIRQWSGANLAAIKRAAKRQYPGAELLFGAAWERSR